MAIERNCRSNYECLVKIKGVTTRPIPFSQMRRADGEGPLNVEDVIADLSVEMSEEDLRYEDSLRSIMSDILEWAISFLSKPSQATIREIYFNQKTVKEHSEDEFVTVFAIYKRLKRSYPILRGVILEELDDLDPEVRKDLEELFGIGGDDGRR